MKSRHRGYFIILCLLLSSSGYGLDRLTQDDDTSERSKIAWEIFPSPTKNKLSQIIMFSPNDGIICGKFLGRYNGKSWKLLKTQPPSLITTKVFANNKNNIWIIFNTYANSSKLFRYKSGKWKEVYHPFANKIYSMHLTENNIDWIGGDREIAHKVSDKKWEFLPFPNCRSPITYIYPVSKNKLWVKSEDNKLYFYNGTNWKQYLKNFNVIYAWFESPRNGYFLTDNVLYKFNGKKLIEHSRNISFKNLTKMAFLSNGEIWGIGRGAFLLHYKSKWDKISVPTFEDFYDISMVSSSEGWIAGNNGTLLHYSSKETGWIFYQHTGFNQIKIIPISKAITDEYGVAIEDLNNDGLKDIYTVCIYGPNRLYINKSIFTQQGRIGAINFNEEASLREVRGISDDKSKSNFSELDLSAGLADVDNDGDIDLYICNSSGNNKLMLNNGEGFFRDVSNQSGRGTDKNERTTAAVWGDVDNDGDLDLFITNEYSTNRLYLNNGDGYFTEVTKQAGLETLNGGMGAAFSDIDNDGDLDLCIANWAAPDLLYENVSSKVNGVKFIDVSKKAGIAGDFYAKSSGVVFADIDNDGDPDLFITKRKQSNRLYLNNGLGKFTDVTDSFIGTDSMLSYGATFGDFDQDGFMDLYVTNVGDNVFYKNIKGKKFIPVTEKYDAQMSGYNAGSACGDIDNDGDLDLYTANFMNGTSTLFINTVNNKRFIKFKITGTKSNRDAVGVKILLYKKGGNFSKDYLIGSREISGGSGFCSYNAKEVQFGLPEIGYYDAEVYFPASGTRKILKNIESGKTYKITEENGFAFKSRLTLNLIQRIFIDHEIQFESFKFFLVLILITISAIWGNRKYNWNLKKQLGYNSSILGLYFLQIYIFLYKGFFLSVLLPLLSIFIMLAILHLTYERIIMVKISREEKKATRDRIARDLHDDLASTLSSSVIYTDALKRLLTNISKPETQLISKINTLLQEASEAITDIVWTVSPLHDKLEDIILRLREFLTDFCKNNNIEYQININIVNKEFAISEEVKRNIYLIFKEAINNIMKHSGATSVVFSVEFNLPDLEITIQDNGIGFNNPIKIQSQKSLGGNGLLNMKKRADEINAQLNLVSSKENGTRITLLLKMT